MRAVWYEEFGPAADVLQVGEMEAPEPGPGEVAVRVVVSGVNPVDVKRRQGGRGTMEAPRVIPHFDGAGMIDAVGEGIEAARVGERVWIYEAQWGGPLGSAAERVVVPADRAVPLPKRLSFDEGAALGIPALTAHRAVFADGPVSGQTILVTGGGGVVGAYAVQFAKLAGARVIATVSGDEKAARASACAADEVVNYRDEDVAERALEVTDGEGVERIVEVEFGGNLEAARKALRTGGVIATYASGAVPEPRVPFYPLLYKSVTIHFVLVFLMPEEAKHRAVADIGGWLEAGELSHQIGARFPLEAAAAAHEAVEAGAFGKVVLEIG